jgi:hypothetical protein
VSLGGHKKQTADSRQQTADRRQQAADSRQQTADSRQQTADSRQQTAEEHNSPSPPLRGYLKKRDLLSRLALQQSFENLFYTFVTRL